MSARVIQPGFNQSPRGTELRADGSVVVTYEQLKQFGNGDERIGRRELRLLLSMDRDEKLLSGPTDRPATVRLAGPEDEDAILELLMTDLQENAEHIAPIDKIKVMEQIRVGTRSRGGFTAVTESDGKPVAVTILQPTQWWWSQGWYLFEIVMFVHPDHRHGKHIDDLLAFQKWASDELSRQMGVRSYLINGVLGAWRIRAKIALYRRKFRQAGACFCYPAPPTRGN